MTLRFLITVCGRDLAKALTTGDTEVTGGSRTGILRASIPPVYPCGNAFAVNSEILP